MNILPVAPFNFSLPLILVFYLLNPIQGFSQSIGGFAWCDTSGEGLLVIADGTPSFPVFADFFFGAEDDRNGTYRSDGYHPNHNGMLFFPRIDCPTSERLDVVITFNGLAYTFLDGKYCEDCPDPSNFGNANCNTFEECGFDLLSFIDENQLDILCKQWLTDCNTTSAVYRSGKVGVGTVNPVAQLTVKEGIISDKAKVEPCEKAEWCDYVFDENYELMPLHVLADYIKEHKRLPKTPSAEEVAAAGGFELYAVTLNQQEKIEEAFLHLIRLKKEADELQQKIEKLKTENQGLSKD